jgi:hypothetical protein
VLKNANPLITVRISMPAPVVMKPGDRPPLRASRPTDFN